MPNKKYRLYPKDIEDLESIYLYSLRELIVLHKTSRKFINIEELKRIIKDYIDSCIDNNNAK